MSPEQIFKDLGIEPIRAVEYMGYLDLSTDELAIPQRYAKFEAVLHYLKAFPEDTQKFLIKKATYNKTADKLNCMFEYTHLLIDKKHYENERTKIKEQKSAITASAGMTDLKELFEIGRKEYEIESKLQLNREEIELYHR